MGKKHKPRSGSRGFWPRKRAANIYDTFKTHPEVKEVMPLDFAGYKAGMTHLIMNDNRKASVTHGKEIATPVTILDCPSLVVAGIKTYKADSNGAYYSVGIIWAEKVSKDLERKTRVPKKIEAKKPLEHAEKNLEKLSDIRLLVHTKPRESGIGKKRPELFEIVLGGDLKQKLDYAKQRIGKEIRAPDVFKEGEFVDVKAVTKGKGFEGPVKRFGIKIRSRKNKKKMRHVGTLGPRQWARVRPNISPMAGQLGFQTRTEINKRILKIGSKSNPKAGWPHYGLVNGDYILLSGSVPGPKKRLIMLRKSLNPPKRTDHVEVKQVAV